MKRWILAGLLALSMSAAAQEATETAPSDPVEFPLTFPLGFPTGDQLAEAYDCDLETAPATGDIETLTACELAVRALELAAERGEKPIADDETALLVSLVEANPALVLRLSLIATYYDAIPLVSAPDFGAQPVTAVHLTYTFFGLGPSNDYDIAIDLSGETPAVTGTAEIDGGDDSDPVAVPETVDAAVVQALLPALSDLLPIAEQFSSVPCWDYYPDWAVEFTLEDGTVVAVVNNESNVVGIGGPWQVEIDGRNYMQYSNTFSVAVVDLLEALGLPLGETAAMGCGGITDPLWDAFPRDPDA